MLRWGWAVAISATLMAMPAMAAVVRDCGDTGRVEFIAEPWAENSRTFYNGEIRIALIDTEGEPACCSSHLMVLYTAEPKDEPAYRACKLITQTEGGLGFSGVDFAHIKATYDPKRGVLLSVPVARMSEDGASETRSVIKVRLTNKPASVAIEP
jgi:hypothetical protein